MSFKTCRCFETLRLEQVHFDRRMARKISRNPLSSLPIATANGSIIFSGKQPDVHALCAPGFTGVISGILLLIRPWTVTTTVLKIELLMDDPWMSKSFCVLCCKCEPAFVNQLSIVLLRK